MNYFKKAKLFFEKEGAVNTCRRILEKCKEKTLQFPNWMREKIFSKRYVDEVHSKIEGKRLFVVIPCIDWNIPLYQRPHQIAMELSKLSDSHVLFVSDEYKYDNFAGIRNVNENLDLLSYRIVPDLKDVFSCAADVTVIMCWPRQAQLLDYIPYSHLVYEYIDDLSLFYYYTEELINKHYSLIAEADLTVCTAKALYDDAKATARRIILSPNAGDYDFFHNSRNCEVLPELEERIRKYDCVLGYYGCLATWFDYDTVIDVARRRSDWCFVLVGYCFDGTVDRLKEAGLSNILVYPAQPYTELPKYAVAFDVQLIPFVINDITMATSPVKVFEYMATGKPILTSRMPELDKYESVVKYDGPDEFIEKIEMLRKLDENDEYFTVMEKEARANTWKARVSEILDNIK